MKRHALFLATALSVAALGAASVASAQADAPARVTQSQAGAAQPALAGERPQRHGQGHHGRRGHGAGMMGFGGGIERFDSDADGRVSRAEFDAGRAAHTAAREARAAAKPDAGKAGAPRRGSRHAGHDGVTQPAGKPHGARMAIDFDAIDTNKDGHVVRSEAMAHGERMQAQMRSERERRFTASFTAADLNKDGKLSRVEVDEKMPRLAKRFAWMDDNRDGFLGKAELEAGARR
ncbi:hypothetical protein H5368_06670 [Luteimonas sp. MC1782]|uniref:hypothetical protein n=1 Tax=Luteimonas sp. MC1782 TaxID=2760305 RepID=UPI0016025E4B|nr:hypothetical protein [Luteimonas sp. MC1782]MBB1472709.1 hypothetical protein [Luteimonas sp. MC1782]